MGSFSHPSDGGPAGRLRPGPGQESVWDYPRPPRVEPSKKIVRVYFADAEIARSARALRVLETASPPTYYLPSDDVAMGLLVETEGHTVCEWKGTATYYDIVVGDRRAPRAAWSYVSPKPGFETLARYISFYPGRVDSCYLDDELAAAQEGGFYGGWITEDIVGPFKGEPGTEGW